MKTPDHLKRSFSFFVMLLCLFSLDLQAQLYYNVVKPDFGPDWQWRFQVQILLP